MTSGQVRALEAGRTLSGSRVVVLDSRQVEGAGEALERLRVGAEPAPGLPADVWLALPFLPAGRYRLWVDLSAAAAFEMHLVAGRSGGPFEAWAIERGGPGATSRDLDLPVGVSGVRLRGDAGARPSVRGAWLQPVAGGGPPTEASRRAASAMRYGRLVVYALEHAYLEPGGLWTSGGRTAELVVQAPAGERTAAFSLRAGPESTPVSVRAGGFSFDAELGAGEERELEIPLSPAGTARLTVQAGRGFRPADVDPSSADRRLLGVRLEARQNLATPPK